MSRPIDGSEQGTQGTRPELNLLRLERELRRLLRGDTDLEATLAATLRTVTETHRWAAARYWRLDDEGVLRIHVAWSADDARLRQVLLHQLERACSPVDGLAAEVLRSRTALWVPDLAQEPQAPGAALPSLTGWHSALLVPVSTAGTVFGLIEFNAGCIPRPDADLLESFDALGEEIGAFCARAQALEGLRRSHERYASIVELAPIGISHVDLNGRFAFVNRRLCEMLGYDRDELLGMDVRDLSHPEDRHETNRVRGLLDAGTIDSFTIEKRYLHKDGTPVWVQLTVAASRDGNGRRLLDVSIVEDITARKAAQTRVHFLATHDEMTGLANRTLFNELLKRAIGQGRRNGRRLAVLFVDLDRFKIVNDSLGHECGDELLKALASRFSTHVRAGDVIGRFGGDEFVLLAHDVAERRAAESIARQLSRLARRPIVLAGQTCRVTASVGIAMYPDDGEDAVTLLKHADMAMYRAKEEGKNNFRFYSADMAVASENRLRTETALREALARNELTLHYQAQIDIDSHEICGVEALLRWTHPELGQVPPTTFVPIAEECGQIVPIGRWVIATACAQGAAWLREGLPPIRVAVNLSPRQFLDADLVASVGRALNDTGWPPALLQLEITESLMLPGVDMAVEKLNALRALGVRLAVDDFGTGYSSLSQLKRLPIDVLKIDRSLVRGIPTDRDDMAITETILTLGKTLGVRVVAEGVETEAQQQFLRQHACDEMQGFYFSGPLPPEDFAAFHRARTHRAGAIQPSAAVRFRERG